MRLRACGSQGGGSRGRLADRQVECSGGQRQRNAGRPDPLVAAGTRRREPQISASFGTAVATARFGPAAAQATVTAPKPAAASAHIAPAQPNPAIRNGTSGAW